MVIKLTGCEEFIKELSALASPWGVPKQLKAPQINPGAGNQNRTSFVTNLLS
jgi:hypothetical protein